MKVLIIGSGAREHAFAWLCKKSVLCEKLFCMKGNAGTVAIAENVDDLTSTPKALVDFCKLKEINYVLIGSEDVLALGIADVLRENNIAVFGPGEKESVLETSKDFSNKFAERNGIKRALTKSFTKYEDFLTFLKQNTMKIVLKKSGLAAGKGVLESTDFSEQCSFAKEVLKTDTLLVEEFLSGYEISVFVVMDGNNYKILPFCQDHKKAFQNNTGPNTGGMGAVCPVIIQDKNILEEIENDIIAKTVFALKKEGLMYKGVLFVGLMITEEGPKLLEYNVRFGDPESQSLCMLWKSDFLEFLKATEEGTLQNHKIEFYDEAALGIVVAAKGYPGEYDKNIVVDRIPEDTPNVTIFHAGTHFSESLVRTSGGRCFTVCARSENLKNAREAALAKAALVSFEGAWFRSDIGFKLID